MELEGILRQNLRHVLDESGLSDRQVCLATRDVKPTHLSNFLSGRSGMELRKIEQLCEVLGVTPAALLSEAAPALLRQARELPVVPIRRLPTRGSPAALAGAARRSAVAKVAATSTDPLAFYVRLDEDLDELRKDDLALVSPGVQAVAGDLVLASTKQAMTIGRLRLAEQGPTLVVQGQSVRQAFRLVGPLLLLVRSLSER